MPSILILSTAGSGSGASPVVNVMAAGTGVTGDGVTDDGAAIQALIDANPGHVLFFPRRRVSQTVPCYYSGRTLTLAAASTVLAGEVGRWDGGTTIGFAAGVAGVDITATGSGCGLNDLVLSGGDQWQQIYPSQGVLPSGWTGDATADAAASKADGVRVGGGLCAFQNVIVRRFGRHAWNLSNADTTGGTGFCDCCTLISCYGANCRGYGFYIQGGDANASTFVMCVASVNALGGFFDNGFLGDTFDGCKTDENHFDNAQGNIPATAALASVSRTSGVTTLTFSAPYAWTDAAGGAFKVGQGVTVAGMADTTFNGTFIVRQVVSSTVVKYANAGSNASPSVAGATARLAKMTETWLVPGSTLICPTGGAFRTSTNGTSRTTIVNLYTEGAQNPAGNPATPYVALGGGTTVVGGIGLVYDFSYGTPTVVGQVGGIGLPGFTGAFPSVSVPLDVIAQSQERAGLTDDQIHRRIRQTFDGNATLWTWDEGPSYLDTYPGAPTSGAPVIFRLNRASGLAQFSAGVSPGYGISGARPSTPVTGTQWFDTTLGIPVWWNGSAWKNAAGATV